MVMITNNKGRLSKDEINSLVKEADKYRAEDAENKKKVELRNAFNYYIDDVRKTIDEIKIEDDKRKMKYALDEAVYWLDKNRLADIDDIKNKMEKLQVVSNLIMRPDMPN